MGQRIQTCLDGSLIGVELTEACGEWFVRVIKDGSATVLSFEIEADAIDFADRERLRLRLQKFDRL